MASQLLVLVLAVCLADRASSQGDNVLNTELHECLQLVSRNDNPSNITWNVEARNVEIQSTCLQEFVWKFGGIKWADFNITERDIEYINSLTHSLVQEHNILKRQAGPGNGPRRIFPMTGFRIRREYRRLTDRDRMFFHEAVNSMKRRGEYDTFANLHQGAIAAAAHDGPNFFGWHRVYCALIEEALRRINRRVTLPYWDSSLDFDMDNPVNSIVWSERFLGNGDGIVTSGPFANWQTPTGPLTRNIGGASRLISKEVIRDILTRCRNIQIAEPTAENRYNLELAHGGPHVWIGGQMRGIDSAAHDPVFFLHHAFIDYIWELFRIQQARRCGVNPTTDYPPTNRPGHGRNEAMAGFPQYRNIDGLQSYWIRYWYRYERSPTCNRFRRSCRTPYLRCDVRRSRCVSIARMFTVMEQNNVVAFGFASNVPMNTARVQAAAVQSGPTFKAPPSDGRTTDVGRRRKRAANEASTNTEFGKSFNAPPSDSRTSESLGYNIASGLSSSDTALHSNQVDPSHIAFNYAAPMPLLPVPILHKADATTPAPSKSGPKREIDDTVFIPVKIFYRGQGGNNIYQCQVNADGLMQVDVRARGLSYIGLHDNYAQIDTRSAIATSTIYMAVHFQANSSSEVLLTATDGCGQMCQARCLDTRFSARNFYDCNGVIHVDSNSAFGNAATNAVHNVLREHGGVLTDTSGLEDIQFLCA